ncbi:MAG: hemerythrin family protein [Betaproteobacteria bacterium]|nr:hemerythrin family protein [Betaproteobacteria bacterium]
MSAERSAEVIEWSPQYEVGIRFIDGQHRQMLDLVNRVLEGVHARLELGELIEILRDLVRLTEHHFATEEKQMAASGADADAHRAEHRQLLESLRAFTDRLDAESAGNCSLFLRAWLLRHIETTDRQFAAFLRERGMQ